MKNSVLIFSLLFTNLIFSQSLNIKFVEQITKISFLDIDDLMVKGNGYRKIREENEGKQRLYAKIFNENPNTIIVISAVSSMKLPINALDITVGKNINLQKIKDDLVENGYLNTGVNKLGFIIFEKDKLIFLISNEPNSAEAYQILVTYRE